MMRTVHGGTITFRSILLECFMEPAKGVFDLCGRMQYMLKYTDSSPVQSW